jgi:retinol dehydrogenase 12
MKQIALITGANSGIGLETAKGLAAANFDLLLVARSTQKAEITKNEIKKLHPSTTIDFEVADLEDIPSVINAANNIKKRYQKIDLLVNNAGYSPDSIEFTKQGYEKSFVANHLGHFALTNTLLDLLKTAESARIINVASAAYTLGKFERMFQKNNSKVSALNAYGDGKLANVFFTKALAGKLEGTSVTTYSLHPGVVNSNFGKNFTGFSKFITNMFRAFMITPEKGAQTSLYLATTPLENIAKNSGNYFDKSKVKLTNHKDLTAENLTLFWQKSEAAVEEIMAMAK